MTTNEDSNAEAPIPTAVEAAIRKTDRLYSHEQKKSQAEPSRRVTKVAKKAAEAESTRRAELFAPRPGDRAVPKPAPAGSPFPGETVVGPDRSHVEVNQVSQEQLEELFTALSDDIGETVNLMRDAKKIDGQRVEELTELRQREAELQAELSQVTASLDELESKGMAAEEAFDRTQRHETDLVILAHAVHRFICDHLARKEGADNFSDLHPSLKDQVLWRASKLEVSFSAIISGRWTRLHRYQSPAPQQVDIVLDLVNDTAEKLDKIAQKYFETK